MYLSRMVKSPGDGNCEVQRTGASTVKIEAENGLNFKCQYIYVAIESSQSMKLKVLPSFLPQKGNVKRKTEQKDCNETKKKVNDMIDQAFVNPDIL